jgi:hypothetical protein
MASAFFFIFNAQPAASAAVRALTLALATCPLHELDVGGGLGMAGALHLAAALSHPPTALRSLRLTEAALPLAALREARVLDVLSLHHQVDWGGARGSLRRALNRQC